MLRLLASALMERQISRELYLSLTTVKSHMRGVLPEPGVSGHGRRWGAASWS
jgi:DNA-binding NarL/FixJ family response regulator